MKVYYYLESKISGILNLKIISEELMRRLLIALLAMFLILAVLSCSMSDNLVAKVGSRKITVEQFKAELAKSYGKKENYQTVTKEQKEQVLNTLAKRERELCQAYDMDLDKDESILKELNYDRENMILQKLFEAEIVDKLVSEEEMRAYYEKLRVEYHAAHILIAYQGAYRASVSRSKEDAGKLVEKLRAEAVNGKDFNELALKNSDDPSAATNRGDLGFFTADRMVPEFSAACMIMQPGEISPVVETDYGLHLVKLIEKRDNPRFDQNGFEAAKQQLKMQMTAPHRERGMKMWEDFLAGVREKAGFKPADENIGKASARANELEQAQNFKIESFSDEDKKLVLATWNDGKYTLGDLFDIYTQSFTILGKHMLQTEQLSQDVVNFATQRRLLLTEAGKRGFTADSTINAEYNKRLEHRMAGLVQNKQVRDKVDESDAELLKYYQENPAEFTKEAMIELWEVSVKDEKQAQKIYEMAKAGQNFETLAEKYTEDTFYKPKKGYVDFKRLKGRGTVSESAFELGPNAIGGPVKYNNNWVVFKTGELKPAEVRPFEEMKNVVKSKMKRVKTPERRTAWEKELETAYKLKINEKVLEQI